VSSERRRAPLDGTARRVGGTLTHRVDIRIVATTNRGLRRLIVKPLDLNRCHPARRAVGYQHMSHSKADALRGTLDLRILETLEAMGPLHG
jgi:hypothetical protein